MPELIFSQIILELFSLPPVLFFANYCALLRCLVTDLEIFLDSPFEDQPLTSSPDVFQSSPSSIQRVEDSDGIEDKGEQPSPVSVLEQFFVDATCYASTISEPGTPSSGSTNFSFFFFFFFFPIHFM